MFPAASCRNICHATSTGWRGICPGLARGAAVQVTSAVPDQPILAYQGNPMNVAMTGNRMGEDLMTRRQVAYLFRVTSAAVATWARRGRLPEVRNEAGRPRYRREDVEALFRSGTRAGRQAQVAAPGPLRGR